MPRTLPFTVASSLLVALFGTSVAYGGLVGGVIGGFHEDANNAYVDVLILPEPGTAVLLGLGLAGLAGSADRPRRGGFVRELGGDRVASGSARLPILRS